MTQKEDRDTVSVCRERIKKTKAHLQLNLARDVRGIKKGFYKYIINKKKPRESVSLLLNVRKDPVMKATEKAKVFSTFFINKACFQESQNPENSGKVWSKEDLLSVEEDQARQCLNKLDIHKSVRFDSMQPQELRELADVILRLLSTIFERSG